MNTEYNKTFIFIIVVLSGLIINLASCSHMNKKSSTAQIRYIANDGFLIQVGDKKILIDALFGKEDLTFCDTPGSETIDQIINSEKYFENIDLIVATHNHRDHFHAPFVREFLQNNKQVKFISTNQSCNDLKVEADYQKIKGQIIEITPDTLSSISKKVNGISTEVFRFRHSSYYEKDRLTGKEFDRHAKVQNFGVLFSINDLKIFHSGDSSPRWIHEYKNFRLDKKGIDIALLDRAFLWDLNTERIDLIKNYISPQNIILMHIHPNNRNRFTKIANKLGPEFPPVTIFKEKSEKRRFKIIQKK
ncbi:MAG TPA: MBL fold metallo-hydrolase [bacterium]|nr:MBL fold metallo-hydrolase [bacterium]